MSDLDVSRLQQRAYRRAMRDAVDALKHEAGCAHKDACTCKVGVWDAVIAIEFKGRGKR